MRISEKEKELLGLGAWLVLMLGAQRPPAQEPKTKSAGFTGLVGRLMDKLAVGEIKRLSETSVPEEQAEFESMLTEALVTNSLGNLHLALTHIGEAVETPEEFMMRFMNIRDWGLREGGILDALRKANEDAAPVAQRLVTLISEMADDEELTELVRKNWDQISS